MGIYPCFAPCFGRVDHLPWVPRPILVSEEVVSLGDVHIATRDGEAMFFADDIDLSEYADGPYLFRFFDNLGKKAEAYAGDVGGGETLGYELWEPDAAVFASGTYSWAAYGGNTIANVNGELEVTYVGNINGAEHHYLKWQDLIEDVEDGSLYKQKADTYYSGPARYITLRVRTGDASVADSDVITTVKETYYITFTSTIAIASDRLYWNNLSTGNKVYLDNLSCKKYLDIPATGLHLVNTKGGSTRNMRMIETGFKPNNITKIEIWET